METMSDEKLKVDTGRLPVNPQLKKGYKLTEMGLIPIDWKVIALKDVSDVVRGGSPRPAGDARYFNGEYIPWLTVASLTNIPDSQIFVSETANSLTEEGSKRSRILDKETVIISNSGATLGVAKLLSVKCCANDGIAALLNIVNCNKLFICYFLNSKTKYFREIVATGNGQPNLNTTLIGSTLIPFPPLPEQESIAKALNDIDALINKLNALIIKKRNLKQGAMQQLLTGKKRLYGFTEEWEMKKLGKILIFQNGFSFKSNAFTETGIPVIRISDINDGKVSLNKAVSHFPIAISTEFIVKANDVLMAMSGATTGKVGVYQYSMESYQNQRVGKFVIKNPNNTCLRFIFHLARSKLFKSKLEKQLEQGAQPNISSKYIESMEFNLPQIKEQEAISQVLSDMDVEINRLEQQRDKIKLIKQGMMQELLTGKTRLL